MYKSLVTIPFLAHNFSNPTFQSPKLHFHHQKLETLTDYKLQNQTWGLNIAGTFAVSRTRSMLKAGDYIGVTMTAAQIESDEPAVAIFWHF